jgi:hypothetical protein
MAPTRIFRPRNWPYTIGGCRLPADARLREVIVAVRADEAGHRDVNHEFSYKLQPAAE